jgi:hypothetical protein
VRTLDALHKCRTASLGGHKDACASCGKERISYNSCGNRHCPKCQANKQALWVEDRMSDAAGLTFKDYKDNSKKKLTKLSGVEFLRRFCMHILPYRFVKIRYYGILSSKQKELLKPLQNKKPETKVRESTQQRIVRLTGFDRLECPFCKSAMMHTVELLPRIRSPGNVLYHKPVRLTI